MRRKLSLAYKILIVSSLTTGIVLNVTKTTSVTALLSYYTSQSNIICLVAFICFLILEILNKKYKSDMYYLIKGAITIAIFITAAVYRIALAPGGFEMDHLQRAVGQKVIANLFVHTISPILVILDYFLFDEKGRFAWLYPIFWLMIPLNYIIYVYTYHAIGGEFFNVGGSKHFAYFFLDYEVLGFGGVVKWIIFMTLCIIAVSYLLVFVDCKLKKKKKRSN